MKLQKVFDWGGLLQKSLCGSHIVGKSDNIPCKFFHDTNPAAGLSADFPKVLQITCSNFSGWTLCKNSWSARSFCLWTDPEQKLTKRRFLETPITERARVPGVLKTEKAIARKIKVSVKGLCVNLSALLDSMGLRELFIEFSQQQAPSAINAIVYLAFFK